MTGKWAGNGFLRPLLSVCCGLFLAGLVMQFSGYNALAAFGALWAGATGLQKGAANGPMDIPFAGMHLSQFALAQSLAKVTPLLFAGLAISLGLRAGLFNIGAQGQMTLGALGAAVVGQIGAEHTVLSPMLHVPLVLLTGAIVGALWGALPGLLKSWRGVHEVISTIMLNYVALDMSLYLVTHRLKDPTSMASETPAIAQSAWLTALVPGANLTAGLLLALLAAILLTFLMRRTALGYEIRAVGLGAEAARSAGIPVARIVVITMALSGALAGLAGAIEVMSVHHRFVEGLAGSYGFDGIAVALLGNLNGLGVTLSALFFGALANGAGFMQMQTDVPDSIAVLVQAVVIIFVGMRFVRQTPVLPPEPTPLPVEKKVDVDAPV